MSQTQTVGKHATAIHGANGYQIVTYHKTNVVKWNTDQIILDTGGWKTVTTKMRMNQTSNQFDLGYHVHQTKGRWYVEFENDEIPFDGNYVVLKQGQKELIQ